MTSPWDFSDRPMMSFHKLPQHILPPCWPIGLALNLSKFLTPDVSSIEGGFLLKNHSLERVSRELWEIPNRNLIEAWVQIFIAIHLKHMQQSLKVVQCLQKYGKGYFVNAWPSNSDNKKRRGSSLVSNGLHRRYFCKTCDIFSYPC